jgi:hypothetical protein
MIWAVAENIISWLRNFRLSAGAGRRGVDLIDRSRLMSYDIMDDAKNKGGLESFALSYSV